MRSIHSADLVLLVEEGTMSSVENFDGDGLADQPSMIYGFERDGDLEIRELSRSGFGEPGTSPGDVVPRERTKSKLTDHPPTGDLPGSPGLERDDCGDDRPAFNCDSCGKPVYVGRTCGSPACSRCWAAAVKKKVTSYTQKLAKLRWELYEENGQRTNIDYNHVVASLPSVLVDSDQPIKRVVKIIQEILSRNWGIEDFAWIYHERRIKPEHRKDVYDHPGQQGEGEMRWKDVLNADDRARFTYYAPHFHLFFPAPRRSFDYSVVEAVEEQTGWVFHRVDDDDNVSVEDLDDLVHQMTYCASHAHVGENGPRTELTTGLKGRLHKIEKAHHVEDEVLTSFCEAAPKLLGVRFANLNNTSCDAEVPADDQDDAREQDDVDERDADRDDHAGAGGGGSGYDPRSLDLESTVGPDRGADEWAARVPSGPSEAAVEDVDEPDEVEECGGDLEPIHEGKSRLADEEWCAQAEHVDGLLLAVAEYERRSDEDDDDEARPRTVEGAVIGPD